MVRKYTPNVFYTRLAFDRLVIDHAEVFARQEERARHAFADLTIGQPLLAPIQQVGFQSRRPPDIDSVRRSPCVRKVLAPSVGLLDAKAGAMILRSASRGFPARARPVPLFATAKFVVLAHIENSHGHDSHVVVGSQSTQVGVTLPFECAPVYCVDWGHCDLAQFERRERLHFDRLGRKPLVLLGKLRHVDLHTHRFHDGHAELGDGVRLGGVACAIAKPVEFIEQG
jgi:hypothetical protein